MQTLLCYKVTMSTVSMLQSITTAAGDKKSFTCMYYNIHLHMSRFLRVFLIFHNWATKNITYNYVVTLAGDYFRERNNRFPKYKNSIFFFSDPRHRTELQACTEINILYIYRL